MQTTSLQRFGRFVVWGLAGFAPWVGACSFVFVEPTPRDHQQRAAILCTSSRLAPVLDTVYVGLQALGVATLATEEGDARPSEGVLVGQAALGVLAAASAIYGYVTVPQCQEAREELLVRVQQEQQALHRYRGMKLSAPATPAQSPPPPAPPAAEANPELVQP